MAFSRASLDIPGRGLHQRPNIETLNKIARALGVTVSELIGINEMEEGLNFLDNRENIIKAKRKELESNLSILKDSQHILSFISEKTKDFQNKIKRGEQIKHSEIRDVTSYLENLSTETDKIISALGSEMNSEITVDEEIKFLSNVKFIDIDNFNNTDHAPENSDTIRRDIINLIKHLQYNIDNLSRESFDKVVKTLTNTIDYEFYKLEKNDYKVPSN